MSFKQCSRCDEFKFKSEFVLSKRSSDGHNGVCKACDKISRDAMKARLKEERVTQFFMPWYFVDFVIKRVHVKES
jgi:hypothetical protein